MTEGICVCVCSACGHAVFPPRVLCPECGGAGWRASRVTRGIVTTTTSARKRVIVNRLLENQIAEVRTDAGPVVIARLLEDVASQTEVTLGMKAGAVVARPVQQPE